MTPPLSGVLPVDKPSGMTSHDVVALVRRALRPDRAKVGHAGTLDPDATGLLLVCIGPATRLADLLADQGKVYEGAFQLGVSTTSEDSSGDVVATVPAGHVARAMVEEALAALTGSIAQVPPMVSAVHHEGKRLYELARQGIVVERAARTVQVERITLDGFTAGERPEGEITVACGKGAYIRTICADLGARLGVGGHMTRLRRLSIGAFDVRDALPVGDVGVDTIRARLVSAVDATAFLPGRAVSGAERIDILHGRAIEAGDVSASGFVRLIDPSGDLIALAEFDETAARLLPRKVLAGRETGG